MDAKQLCVDVARQASARLAAEVSPDLPVHVGRAMAQVDRPEIDLDLGYEPPAALDAASLVARCAVVGGRDVSHGVEDGTFRDLSAHQVRVSIEDTLRMEAPQPPGVPLEQYEMMLAVLTDELVDALGKARADGR